MVVTVTGRRPTPESIIWHYHLDSDFLFYTFSSFFWLASLF